MHTNIIKNSKYNKNKGDDFIITDLMLATKPKMLRKELYDLVVNKYDTLKLICVCLICRIFQ